MQPRNMASPRTRVGARSRVAAERRRGGEGDPRGRRRGCGRRVRLRSGEDDSWVEGVVAEVTESLPDRGAVFFQLTGGSGAGFFFWAEGAPRHAELPRSTMAV
jgi:hypothetical protein